MSGEQRRIKRLPIKLTLEVSSLFKQHDDVIENIDEEIEVFDVSKAGIGFMALTKFPIDYYFNATIEFEGTEGKLMTVVKILYAEPIGDAGYRYGCEFVGLAGIFDYIFDDYEAQLDE